VIKLQGTRFGEIEVEEGSEIVFPRGLFGFPDARRYALLHPGGRGRIAWLQSFEVAGLAFPVVEGAALGPDYPSPAVQALATEAGLGTGDVTILVIVAAQKGGGLVANMLAPLVIDLQTRTGAQIVLDAQTYSPSALIRPGAEAAPPAVAPQAPAARALAEAR
jgi:flagellar assembly factor FliW